MTQDALIVVDMQNGFMGSRDPEAAERLAALPQAIADLIDRRYFHHRIFTWFRNEGIGSFFDKQMGWLECQSSPATDIVPELAEYPTVLIEKTGYSAFVGDELGEYLARHSIRKAYVCGVDTNVCVASMLCDLADRNIVPVAIADLCASHSGEEYHRAGVANFSKWIGEKNIVQSEDLLPSVAF